MTSFLTLQDWTSLTLQNQTSFLNMKQATLPIPFVGLNGVEYLMKIHLCPCKKMFMKLYLSCPTDFLIPANLVCCQKMLAYWKTHRKSNSALKNMK
jgi:hypothetical protein